MPFLRNIIHDLVEKRLWPVAILLAAALVAVPMVLKSDTAAAPPAPSPSAGAPAGTAAVLDAVSLAKPERTRLRLDGPRRNPFQEPGSGSTARPSSSSNPRPVSQPFSDLPPLTDTPTESGGSAPESDIPLVESVPTTPETPEDQEQPTGVPTWTLDVSFGPVEALAELTAIRPGMGIPSNEEPLLIFVGSTDGKTATFLPSSDAVPQGDGTCSPSRRACNQLRLKPGQSAFFDIATESGTKQYVLEVTKIVKRPL